MKLLSARTARITKRLRERAQLTKHELYLEGTFELLTLVREVGTWDSGSSDERYATASTGRGKVYGSGAGGPRLADVVFPESPYRLRALASDFVPASGPVPDYTGALVIVNGSRVFALDDVKVDDAADLMVDVYLTERVGMSPEEVQRD